MLSFLKPVVVSTRNINQSALLTALGADLLSITDDYPQNTFLISASPFLLWYEKHIGLVPYKKYCNQRIRLKEKGRRKKGLPENFVGRREGFEFGEIARVVPWTKREREKYGITQV